jgi:hypothetical protein
VCRSSLNTNGEAASTQRGSRFNTIGGSASTQVEELLQPGEGVASYGLRSSFNTREGAASNEWRIRFNSAEEQLQYSRRAVSTHHSKGAASAQGRSSWYIAKRQHQLGGGASSHK